MLLLVSGATTSIKKYKHKNLGQFLTPQTGNSIDKIIANDTYWACDNGCFMGFDEVAFLKMVKKVQDKPKLLFVTMPDVVCDHLETKKLFDLWHPIMINYYNVPLAYVLQNGVTNEEIPWNEINAIFVGGDTKWKLGNEAAALVKIAKDKGKWVHMGRVNSTKRIQYAIAIGCDSVDGSGYSMFPDAMIPKTLKFLETEQIFLKGCF